MSGDHDHWQDHIGIARNLLDLALARAAVPARSIDCLYKAVVEITYAINQLDGTLHKDFTEKQA